jgi:hypothetical protein
MITKSKSAFHLRKGKWYLRAIEDEGKLEILERAC